MDDDRFISEKFQMLDLRLERSVEVALILLLTLARDEDSRVHVLLLPDIIKGRLGEHFKGTWKSLESSSPVSPEETDGAGGVREGMSRPDEPLVSENSDQISQNVALGLLVEGRGLYPAVLVHVILSAGEELEIRLRVEEVCQG